jgi:foldase protein PrsA
MIHNRNLVVLAVLAIMAAPAVADSPDDTDDQSAPPIVSLSGVTITRGQYLLEMEERYGKKVLNRMVYTDLVLSAARTAGVMPSDAQVEQRIAEMERRSPRSTAKARRSPDVYAQLRSDLTADIAMENLRMRGVAVTDAEVAAYYADHKPDFYLPPRIDTIMVMTAAKADAAAARAMLARGADAKGIARKSGFELIGLNGVSIDRKALSPEANGFLTSTVDAMKVDDIKTVAFNDTYLTIKVTKKLPGGVPPLSDVRSMVTRSARLAKSPSMESVLAGLYKNANPSFYDVKYRDYLTDIVDPDSVAPDQ